MSKTFLVKLSDQELGSLWKIKLIEGKNIQKQIQESIRKHIKEKLGVSNE